MSRGANTFRQRDVTRAIRAAAAAGLQIASVEVQDGSIRVVTGLPQTSTAERPIINPWDEVFRENP